MPASCEMDVFCKGNSRQILRVNNTPGRRPPAHPSTPQTSPRHHCPFPIFFYASPVQLSPIPRMSFQLSSLSSHSSPLNPLMFSLLYQSLSFSFSSSIFYAFFIPFSVYLSPPLTLFHLPPLTLFPSCSYSICPPCHFLLPCLSPHLPSNLFLWFCSLPFPPSCCLSSF